MRRLIPLLCVAGLLGAADEPLTLDRALAEARQGNPDLEAAAAQVEVAQARLAQARAGFLPQVRLSAGYLVTDNPALAFMGLINHDAYAPTIDPNQPPTVDNLGAGATLLAPLWQPGLRENLRAAQAGTEAARSGRRAASAGVGLGVIQSFLAVQRADAYVEAATAALTAAAANRDLARTREQAGTLGPAERLALEAAHAAARERLATARCAREQAATALSALLGTGRKVDAITVVTALPDDETAPADERPEVLAARAQERAAGEQERAATARRWQPRVQTWAGVAYDRGWRQDGEGDSFQAGVSLDWTLFDAGLSTAAVREAQAQRRATAALRRKTELEASRDLAQARCALGSSDERIAAAASALAAAEESARVFAARFREGAATATDLINAETARTAARVRLADARADRLVAQAALRRAQGQTVHPAMTGEGTAP